MAAQATPGGGAMWRVAALAATLAATVRACTDGATCGDQAGKAISWLRENKDLANRLLLGYGLTKRRITDSFCQSYTIGTNTFASIPACLVYQKSMCLPAIKAEGFNDTISERVLAAGKCLCKSTCLVGEFFATDGQYYEGSKNLIGNSNCSEAAWSPTDASAFAVAQDTFGSFLKCLSMDDDCKELFKSIYHRSQASCKEMMRQACLKSIGGGACQKGAEVVSSTAVLLEQSARFVDDGEGADEDSEAPSRREEGRQEAEEDGGEEGDSEEGREPESLEREEDDSSDQEVEVGPWDEHKGHHHGRNGKDRRYVRDQYGGKKLEKKEKTKFELLPSKSDLSLERRKAKRAKRIKEEEEAAAKWKEEDEKRAFEEQDEGREGDEEDDDEDEGRDRGEEREEWEGRDEDGEGEGSREDAREDEEWRRREGSEEEPEGEGVKRGGRREERDREEDEEEDRDREEARREARHEEEMQREEARVQDEANKNQPVMKRQKVVGPRKVRSPSEDESTDASMNDAELEASEVGADLEEGPADEGRARRPLMRSERFVRHHDRGAQLVDRISQTPAEQQDGGLHGF